jgi:flagellar biosynthesis/type III secretory pathway chaperone
MTPDSQTRLAGVLDDEISAAEELATLLQAEQRALAGPSPDLVSAHAAQKIELLQRLERLEVARRDLCGSPGGDGPDRVPADNSAAVASRWRALLAVAAACRSANEVNGYILNARHHQVRQLIDVLRGGAPATYGPQGQARAASLRTIAQA